MFKILKKLLFSEGGWISGAMMLGSMIGQGIMGSKKSKAPKASGVEFGYRDQAQDFGDRMRTEQAGIIDPVRGLMTPGLASVLPEVFSQRPNSSQFDAIAAQQRQLQNKTLATGARGGLLRQQMFEAAKNAASNKLAITENARQNALQRAFGIGGSMMPTTASDLAKEGVGNNMGQFIVNTELRRKLPAAEAAREDSAGAGSGLGSILGGMMGGGGSGGGLGGIFSGFSNLFGGGGGMQTLPTSLMGEGAGSLNFMIQ